MVVKPIAFLEALSLVSKKTFEAEEYLRDKRLTQIERKILSSYILLRKYQNKEVIELLEPLRGDTPFVEASRLSCLGVAHNNLTAFKEAEACYRKAVELNVFAWGKDAKVGTLQNLFILYLNTKDERKLRDTLTTILAEATESAVAKLSEFSFFVFKRDVSTVEKMIPALEARFEAFSDVQKINYLFDLFDHFVSKEDFSSMAKVLERLGSVRRLKNGAMMKYLRALVDFATSGKPLYIYDSIFADSPTLRAELKLLLALETGSQIEAMEHWEELKKLVPHSFGSYLEFTGPKNLFSLVLEKILKKTLRSTTIEAPDGNSLDAKCLQILTSSAFPIKKEDLYEKLWGKEVELKDDLNKLSKVIGRIRKKYELVIKLEKGCYILKA